MTRIHVQLPPHLDPTTTRRQFDEGHTPDRVAYGFHHAERLVDAVTYSVAQRDSRWMASLRRRLSRRLGFDLLHAWQNRRSIDAADVVWTMLETEYLAVLALDALRPWRRRKPVLAQSVWLFNRLDHEPLVAAKWLARRAAVLMTHSKACVPVMQRHFPDSTVVLNLFGISDETFPLTAPPGHLESRPPGAPITVFSAGNDPTRDWKTLFAAFGNDERFRLVLVCRWISDGQAAAYRNVQMLREPTIRTFRESFGACDVAVVPMVRNVYSGITAALEATACGAPVVCSRTGGVPTYFDEDELMFVEPEDPVALRDAVLSRTAAERHELVLKAQRRYAEAGYTTSAMVERYARITDAVLAGRKPAGS